MKKYMGKRQVLKYRLIMLLTLAPVRTFLAKNRMTAGLYQKLKAELYRELQGGRQQ